MINAITQGFAGSTSNNIAQKNKELQTNQTQKAEDNKLERIAKELEAGSYKVDLKATAQAITDTLL